MESDTDLHNTYTTDGSFEMEDFSPSESHEVGAKEDQFPVSCMLSSLSRCNASAREGEGSLSEW